VGVNVLIINGLLVNNTGGFKEWIKVGDLFLKVKKKIMDDVTWTRDDFSFHL
jgi:hypothetical protein